MFTELIIAILIGCTAGIITGLTPGIHINLVSLLTLAASPVLLNYFSLLSLVVFIISMSVTHSFLDSIPSIFLGAPDSAQALGVLPGHRYLLKGYGLMAVKLTIIGSFGALILSIFLFPLFIPIVKYFYPLIKDYIAYILILVVIFMIFRDNKKFWAFLIFTISGIFGYLVLGIPNFENPLFPLLSGLFGISTLAYSFLGSESIPPQKEDVIIKLDNKKTLKALFSGQFSGFLTSMFPGLGAAQAAVLAMQITKKIGDHGFLILIGSINTVNFLLSMVTLLVLNKARNGSIVVISKLIPTVLINHILFYLFAALIAGSVSVFLALYIGKGFCALISKLNYKLLVSAIILFIIVLTAILTGFLGLYILLISTFIGLIPAIKKVSRTTAMGCLLLPVIVYLI